LVEVYRDFEPLLALLMAVLVAMLKQQSQATVASTTVATMG